MKSYKLSKVRARLLAKRNRLDTIISMKKLPRGSKQHLRAARREITKALSFFPAQAPPIRGRRRRRAS